MRFGLLESFPAASRCCRQRHLSASPANITASDDPTVETPVAEAGSVGGDRSSAWKSAATMLTQRVSISAVAGYSSLSIMFLSNVSAMSRSACGSIQVVTKVARFRRELRRASIRRG